jgi:threonine dehydrogenase-like Zn-dependent dehydrogenase
MKAVRLHHYRAYPVVEEVAEPRISGPHDVIIRMGGAGVCRTDLHIIGGLLKEVSGVTLPYTLGHENAGWVHEIGSAVSHVAIGETVIVHPISPAASATSAVRPMICTAPPQPFQVSRLMVAWPPFLRRQTAPSSSWIPVWPPRTLQLWRMLGSPMLATLDIC